MTWLELKFPPPVVAITTAVGMWLAAEAYPALSIPCAWNLELALAFAASGIAIDCLGIMSFYRAKTTINPLKPANASAVVIVGIYRYSRNPMYLGLLLNLSGWAAYLTHPLALFGLPAFVAYLTRFQIIPEERLLTVKFGAEYAAYLSSVRRWI